MKSVSAAPEQALVENFGNKAVDMGCQIIMEKGNSRKGNDKNSKDRNRRKQH